MNLLVGRADRLHVSHQTVQEIRRLLEVDEDRETMD